MHRAMMTFAAFGPSAVLLFPSSVLAQTPAIITVQWNELHQTRPRRAQRSRRRATRPLDAKEEVDRP
jgi:hypothetical protein